MAVRLEFLYFGFNLIEFIADMLEVVAYISAIRCDFVHSFKKKERDLAMFSAMRAKKKYNQFQ